MEIACDEEVVRCAASKDRKEYGDVIMSWVARSQNRGSAVSTGYVKGVRFLKRRFESILNGGRKKKGIFLIGTACAFVLLGNMIHIQSGRKVYADNADPVLHGIEVRAGWQGEVFDSDWAPAGFYDSLDTLAWMAYRGGDIIAEDLLADEDAYIAESIRVLEGSDEAEHDMWVRIVQEAVRPETGSIGQIAYKDYIFYRQGEDAYIGVQSAEDNGLWTIIKMAGYGDWLEKEIGIYTRMTTGL